MQLYYKQLKEDETNNSNNRDKNSDKSNNQKTDGKRTAIVGWVSMQYEVLMMSKGDVKEAKECISLVNQL